MDLQLGVVTPVVNLNPRFDPPRWELDGGIEEVVAVAKAAEAAGYGWLSCSEHVAIPALVAATRGGRYWDPLATLSFVAARTQSIRLLTYVLVLGYHHPLEVVKRYGTLDVASGGRVVLGVGVGTLRPEFDLLGVPYAARGERADDAMRAIRASFGRRAPSYSGPHYAFADMIVDPCGLERPVTMWVGGRTRRSLRRALELGDGWIPFGLELPALRALLDEPALAEQRRGKPGFDVVLAPEPPLDPAGHPEACADAVRAYAAAGSTALNVRFVHRSLAHYLEQLEALAMLVRRLEPSD
ncbi:MAG TPA: TIGR03619 family F420-dependent LLM class oxidoreductase [Acidimicrobiales bacterium]|nr:TIGR03619 family F420-dependent LLM class oxidoreductase [Acidimicrobiales bacterium]